MPFGLGLLLLLLAACTPPAVPDDAGPGLTDTDPPADTDNTNNTDPVAYQGGWPTNPDKDSLDGGTGSTAAVGDRFRRYALVDQFGDTVDLYDLSGHDRPVVVQVFGAWCLPCQQLGDLLLGRPSELSAVYPSVAGKVASGDVLWVGVLTQDSDGAPADADDTRAWYDAFPVPQVPILTDQDGAVATYATVDGVLPAIWLLDDTMRVTLTTTTGDEAAVLDWVEAYTPPPG